MIKLLLIYPEIESSNTNTSTYSLPLGLGSIATYCKENLGEILDVKILDGSYVNTAEQIDELLRFKPDVVGINTTIASQTRGYKIAKLAKTIGAIVVFGGVNSTNLWENMLRNRDFIDAVILYEGELPIFLILNRLTEFKIFGKKCFEGIPNLAYKDEENNIHKPVSINMLSLENLPPIDYSLFDLERFFQNTEKRGFGKALTYYAGKGCAKRGNCELKNSYSFEEYNSLVSSMDVCTFCGRNELGLRNLSEDKEKNLIEELYNKFGVRGFFNVQDTVNLFNKNPIGLNDVWFRLFIGTESINETNIQKLKQRYGLNLIFQVGIESVAPSMRKSFGKSITNYNELISKVELLKKEGIQLHASFIFGGRGETNESMQLTAEFAKKLADYDNVAWILISPQLILPGSPDYKALLSLPRMKHKYAAQDIINIAEINKDFLANFAPELTREDIIEEIRKTFFDINLKHDNNLVLDVKGVLKEEEEIIKPKRLYAL